MVFQHSRLFAHKVTKNKRKAKEKHIFLYIIRLSASL